MTVLSPCGETARRHDHGRFLISLFMPAERREDLWALAAFNHEIARTREVVTDTTLGLIRLQWWREQIDAIYDGRSFAASPVLDALALAIRRHDLPKDPFESLLYAREFDLEDLQPSDLGGLVNYADFTSTPLLALSCRVAGEKMDEGMMREVAIAYGLAGVLRGAAGHLRHRRCYLPASLTPPLHRLYDGFELEGLRPAAQAVAEEAMRRVKKSAPGHSRLLRLHTELTSIYLNQINNLSFNILSVRLQTPPLFCGVRLWGKTAIS